MQPAEKTEEGGNGGIGDKRPIDDVVSQASDKVRLRDRLARQGPPRQYRRIRGPA